MQNVLNCLQVLESLGERRVAGVSELARALELPKTTVHRALATLHAAGWIAPTRQGSQPGWELTAKVLRVARFAGAGDTLREIALVVMHELRRESGETVHLLVRDGDRVILVERLESPHPIRAAQPVGSSTPLHASATGKALLAHLPASEVDALIAAGLPRLTRRTITSGRALRAALTEVRARGYAVNAGESWDGLVAVGAPVLGADGPLAAVSISAPAERMPEELRPRLGELVAAGARRISHALGHRPTASPSRS